MKALAWLLMAVCLCVAGSSGRVASAADNVVAPVGHDDQLYDPFEKAGAAGANQQLIADPLQKFNRGMFVFNDKLYFWVLKPAAKGYSYVVPEPARMCVKRFFLNLTTPVRLVNCFLQGKFKSAGSELTRFLVNTTAGVGGLFDPAHYCWDLTRRDEDTGRTFGRYGIGHGIYIVWPILGPSSARDTVGLVGDTLLDPLFYLDTSFLVSAGVDTYETINSVSLKINEYDEFKKSAIDPYVSMKNAYVQNREHDLKK